jgi:hypothetical protein
VGGAKGEGDKEMNVIKVLYVHVWKQNNNYLMKNGSSKK